MDNELLPKTLIADDHGLFRTGLSLLLKDRLGAKEIIEVSDFDDAIDRLASEPDIKLALFDLSMPGMSGPESLVAVKETYPDVRIAVVSASDDRDHVLAAILIGLHGYIPKSLPEEEIVRALQQICAGRVYVPPLKIASAGQPNRTGSDAEPNGPAPAAVEFSIDDLTPRQRDVVRCILRGRSNKEIARELDIAEGTVKVHLGVLFAKFAARNRTELATLVRTLSA